MPSRDRLDYRRAIGRRIADARSRRGLTQTQVADLIGVSERTLSQWESGRGVPSADDAGRLAQAFRCSLDWLIGRPTPGHVHLVNRGLLDLLRASDVNDDLFRARHSMLAVVCDESAEPCDNMKEFGTLLAEIQAHRDRLPRIPPA